MAFSFASDLDLRHCEQTADGFQDSFLHASDLVERIEGCRMYEANPSMAILHESETKTLCGLALYARSGKKLHSPFP
jgi:hypothetical protein